MWTPLLPVWTKPAAKQLAKLPANVRAQIDAAVNRYAATGIGHIKALKGKLAGRYRLSTGDYRAVFTVLMTAREMIILAAGDRKDIYD